MASINQNIQARDKRLKPLSMKGSVFNINNKSKFDQAMNLLKEVTKGLPLYIADNLITWNKNLSFLRDPFFIDYLNSEDKHNDIKSTVWRLYVLTYFAELALNVNGDFVELGVLQGNTVEQVIKRLKLHSYSKKYYLYDLFDWKEEYEHDAHLELKDSELYSKVKEKFAKYSFVKIIKGSVPDSFKESFPEEIAFAHIDMNHPNPERDALEFVLPRLSNSGIVILDDYGWWSYSAQKRVLDPIANRYGLKILELPTGQGLLIKNYNKLD